MACRGMGLRKLEHGEIVDRDETPIHPSWQEEIGRVKDMIAAQPTQLAFAVPTRGRDLPRKPTKTGRLLLLQQDHWICDPAPVEVKPDCIELRMRDESRSQLPCIT